MQKSSSDRPVSVPLRMGAAEWGVMVLCAVLWGSSYIGNAILITELPPLTITASRLLLAATLLVPLALASGHRIPTDPSLWLSFGFFTLLSNIGPYLLVLAGQRHTSSGLAAILIATAPLFTALFAHAFTHDEKLRPAMLAGIVIGIAGVAVVMGPEALEGLSSNLLAKLVLVAAAVLYAIGGIYSKRFVRHPPLVIASVQMSCGFVISLGLALVFEQPWALAVPSFPAIAALLWVGFISSALSAIAYFVVLRTAGATNAMLVTLLVPFTPILLGRLMLGEILQPRELWGAAIIALGLLVIDGRILQLLRR